MKDLQVSEVFKDPVEFVFSEYRGGLNIELSEVSVHNVKHLELIENTLHNYISNREWDISFNGKGKLYISEQCGGYVQVKLRNQVFPHSEFGDSDTNELFRFKVKTHLVEHFLDLNSEPTNDFEVSDDFIENFEVPFNLQIKTIDGDVLPKNVRLDCLNYDVHMTSEQSLQIAERIYRAVKSDTTGAVFLTLGGDYLEIKVQCKSGDVEVFEFSDSPLIIEIDK
jgi:hypothetical protein